MKASGYDRAKLDYYVEPAWTVQAVADAEGLTAGAGVSCWDPACGGGTIPGVLRARGLECFASDIEARGAGNVCDFFDTKTATAEVIISNPPFRVIEPWVRHALTLATDRVIILGRLAVLEGRSRKAMLQGTPLARVWVSSRRISMPPGDSNVKAANGSVAYAWFVWEHGHVGPATIGWL